MADLKSTFCGLPVKNPFILGAGPLTGTFTGIKKAVDAGYGAIITKTASQFEYYHKFPYPRYDLLNYEMSNRGRDFRDWIWFHNDHNSPVGPMEFSTIIAEAAPYCKEHNCLLVGSFAASSIEEWKKCAKAYEQAGADVLQLNFCCSGPGSLQDIAKGHQTTMYGDVLGRNIDAAEEVMKAVVSVVNIPVSCKLPPAERLKSKDNVARLTAAGASAVELYANAKGLRIDIENAAPIGTGTTSYNAHGFLGDVEYDVSQIKRENDKINLIAGRGVRCWSDAMELIMAGAQVAELCTIAFVYGLKIVDEFTEGFSKFIDRKGYTGGVDQLRGIALEKQLKPSEIRDNVTPVVAVVDVHACRACGRCEEVCAYDAAHLFYKNGKGVARIDKTKCVGCTLCTHVCPYSAIKKEERTIDEYLEALYSVHPESLEAPGK